MVNSTRSLPSITQQECYCSCGWTGTVWDCEPDVDDDGSLGCPECFKVVQVSKYSVTIKAEYQRYFLCWHEILLLPIPKWLALRLPDRFVAFKLYNCRVAEE
jgi:hypothetical protein